MAIRESRSVKSYSYGCSKSVKEQNKYSSQENTVISILPQTLMRAYFIFAVFFFFLIKKRVSILALTVEALSSLLSAQDEGFHVRYQGTAVHQWQQWGHQGSESIVCCFGVGLTQETYSQANFIMCLNIIEDLETFAQILAFANIPGPNKMQLNMWVKFWRQVSLPNPQECIWEDPKVENLKW